MHTNVHIVHNIYIVQIIYIYDVLRAIFLSSLSHTATSPRSNMYNMNVYIVVHIVHNFSWVPTKTCCTYYVLQGLMYKKYILCMNFRQGTNTTTTITPNEKCWVDTHHSTTSTAMTQQTIIRVTSEVSLITLEEAIYVPYTQRVIAPCAEL